VHQKENGKGSTYSTRTEVKKYNFSEPRSSKGIVSDSDSPDIYKRRINKTDLTTWGGLDYENNTCETQYYNNKGKKQRISVSKNKNAKFNRGNIKIQPLANRAQFLNTNSTNTMTGNSKDLCNL
jgi:hypothetical protein